MVNKIVFVVFTQFLLIYLQLGMGNLGWTLPFAQLGALYTVLSLGRNYGIAAAMLNSLVFASLYGSWNLLLIILNPLLAGLTGWWIDRHGEDVRKDFYFPGIWAGALAGFPALAEGLFRWAAGGRYPGFLHILALQICWSAAVSAGLFLVVIFLGEALNEYLGLPRFLSRKGGHKR